MTIYQSASPNSNSITQPACSKCGAAMLLTHIQPVMQDRDKRTFVCPTCQHSESAVVECQRHTMATAPNRFKDDLWRD